MFSKRHYEAIAQAMQEATMRTRIGDNKANPISNAIDELGAMFKHDNQAFDLDRFVRACVPGANVKARS